MSNFIKNIFPTPVFAAVSDNEEIQKLISELVYKWKDETYVTMAKLKFAQAGLMSYHWDLGSESNSRADFEKFGITTFYSGNLAEKSEWEPVSDFVKTISKAMIGELYQGKMVITNMWATIYPKGAYVPEHIHNNSLYSGVYYVKAKPSCGNLVFKDPAYISKTMSSQIGTGFPNIPIVHTQEVEEGLMVLFPSWLPHSSQPNESDEDRIILSFNLDFPND
jgi:uncharacterized protein (TIGR02466 family)